MKGMGWFLVALGLICAPVRAGTIYVDTAGNGAAATNSGTTNTTTPTASGTAATAVTTTITLDTNTNLTGVITTPGVTQSAINIAGATNTARTIFWITGVTGCTGTGACSVTVDTAPTGITTNSWAIGGRYLFPSGTTIDAFDGALGLSGGQDIVQFNTTPATRTTAPYILARNPGTATTGLITIQGAAGSRPTLQMTGGTGAVVNMNSQAGYKITNLQLASASATDVIQNTTGGLWIDNLYVSSCGGTAIAMVSQGVRLTNSEISGCAGDGVSLSSSADTGAIVGNYIHNNTGSGINVLGTSPNNVYIEDNLIVSNSGRGIYVSGTVSSLNNLTSIVHNTIANNTLAGLEIASANAAIMLRNNIIYENSASHPAALWDAGSADSLGSHGYNVFFNAGAGGTTSGLTVNSTEFTTDPKFVNSGSGNYALQSSSPAAGTGYPSLSGGSFPGTGNSNPAGYLDIGAFQRQVTASSSGLIGGGL